ncbi:MAG: urea transporter [Rothia sp. (in: high G+C Gram-positive bacteria)]|nr:urea transporter [Rothia sp. (in: high G+C Gram-positive bacteria)]
MFYILSALRGISQIFFAQNAATGLLVLAGMALFDLRAAALMLLGSAVQGATGLASGHKDQVQAGLFGFNGALVGAATGVQLQDWTLGITLTLVGAATCTPVGVFFERLFASPALNWAKLPVSTAPFCTVTGLLITAVASLSVTGPLTTGEGLAGAGTGIANSIAEVILADGPFTGVLIALGLVIAPLELGAFALYGAALALIIATLTHGGLLESSTGLYGYSAVLVSIAVGAIFWPEASLTTRIIGATAGVALTTAIQPLLALTPLPVYTWPFLLSLWIVLAARAATTAKQHKNLTEAQQEATA